MHRIPTLALCTALAIGSGGCEPPAVPDEAPPPTPSAATGGSVGEPVSGVKPAPSVPVSEDARRTGGEDRGDGGVAVRKTGEDVETALPRRRGERPETSDAPEGTRVAHQQKTQRAPAAMQEALLERVRTLDGVTIGRSFVSVPGARAFHLDAELAAGPRRAFAARTEFGHLHPPHDGSLHLNLPRGLTERAIDAGWAERHPRAQKTVMVYGPRDEAELDVVWRLVQAGYDFAVGDAQTPGE